MATFYLRLTWVIIAVSCLNAILIVLYEHYTDVMTSIQSFHSLFVYNCDDVFTKSFNFSLSINATYSKDRNIRIYNIFPYDGEKEMLLIRLNELNDVVSFFIILESTRSFNPNKKILKPLKFNPNDTDFEPFKDKLLHVIIPSYIPSYITTKNYRTWFRYQAIVEFISQYNTSKYYPNPNDLFYGSDLDEIVRSTVLLPFKRCNLNRYNIAWPISFHLDWFIYNFRCKLIDEYPGGVALTPFKYLYGNPNCINNCSLFRLELAKRNILFNRKIPESGWHISYFMSIDDIILKVSHAGDKNNKDLNAIKHNIQCFVSNCHHIAQSFLINETWRDQFNQNNTLLQKLCSESQDTYYPSYITRQACSGKERYLNMFKLKEEL